MNIGRIHALIMRHLYVYTRSIPRLMDLFFWPVMDILILGFLSIYLNSISLADINVVALLLGGAMMWQMTDRAQNALSTYFLEDVWYRNFLNIFVTPLRISEFFLAGAILSIIRIAIVGTIMFFVALFLYKFNVFLFGASLFPYIFNLFLFGLALAIFINAIIIRFGSSAQVLAFGMAILVQPVSAVYYPVEALPKILQYIAYILPSTYVFESMRDVARGGVFEWNTFLISLILNIFYLAITSWFFVFMFKKIKMKGKLLKIQD